METIDLVVVGAGMLPPIVPVQLHLLLKEI